MDLQDAQRVLAAQPFNELVGARLTDFGNGTAALAIDIADRHRQQFGLVHGGVLAYLADNSLTFAAGSVLGPSVVTAGVAIEYVRGARSGLLRAIARVDHHTDSRAVCSVRIVTAADDGTETLRALARGTVTATKH